MGNMILGAVLNYSYEDIKPWVKSIKALNTDISIGLIAYNMASSDVEKLTKENVKIFAFKKDNSNNLSFDFYPNFSIMVDRFLHASLFLNELTDINNIIFTDIKDVIFQTDPFKYFSNKLIYLGSENLTYEEEPWGKNNILKSFGPYFYEKVKNNKIYCAGVIGGTRKALVDLFLNLYLISKSTIQQVPGGGGPDQAALNILISLTPYKDIIQFNSGHDTWVCHAGATIQAIECRDDQVGIISKSTNKLKLEENRPKIVNNKICNKKDQIYSIVHQYDRIPEWSNLIKSTYS